MENEEIIGYIEQQIMALLQSSRTQVDTLLQLQSGFALKLSSPRLSLIIIHADRLPVSGQFILNRVNRIPFEVQEGHLYIYLQELQVFSILDVRSRSLRRENCPFSTCFTLGDQDVYSQKYISLIREHIEFQ